MPRSSAEDRLKAWCQSSGAEDERGTGHLTRLRNVYRDEEMIGWIKVVTRNLDMGPERHTWQNPNVVYRSVQGSWGDF